MKRKSNCFMSENRVRDLGWFNMPSCSENRGSVTIETTFSLFVFAILFLFMLYFYEILETQTSLQIDSGVELRQKMLANSKECYSSVSVDNAERISLRYNLTRFIPAPARSFEATSRKIAYVGSCPGRFMSRFDGPNQRRVRQPD